MSGQPLAPAELPANYPEGVEVYRAENFSWQHMALLKEMDRLAEAGYPAYNLPGLASNLRIGVADARRLVEQLLLWGDMELAEPGWDFAPGQWVKRLVIPVALSAHTTEGDPT